MINWDANLENILEIKILVYLDNMLEQTTFAHLKICPLKKGTFLVEVEN
jgi:hypothetical protein